MKKIFFLFGLSLILFGCSEKNEDLSYSEVNLKDVNQEIQDFVTEVEDTNGVHLYEHDQNTKYIFINGYIVEQGNEATYFEDMEVFGDGDTLTISYSEKSTAEYTNKSLTNRLLYEIKTDKEYKSIKLLKNGKEIAFKVVYGSGK